MRVLPQAVRGAFFTNAPRFASAHGHSNRLITRAWSCKRLRTVSISAPCSSCVSGASSATARNQKRSRFTARSYCCAAISETSTAPASSLSRLHSMIASAYVSLRSIQWNKCPGAARRSDLLRLHFGQASTKLNVLVCANREYGKKWSTSQPESNLQPQ